MNNQPLKWLYAVPGRKKLYILALAVAQALAGVSGVLEALLLRSIVDNAVAGKGSAFWRYFLLLVLLVLGTIALRAVIRWLNELAKATVENAFKGRLLAQLLRRDYATVSAIHSGEWMNRLTNDTVVIAEGYVEILPGLSGMVVRMVSALAVIIALDARFAAILIPGGIVVIAFTHFFRRILKRLHKLMQEQDGRLRVFLQERIGSMMIIRSFAAEDQIEREAAEKMDRHRAARMRRNRFANISNMGLGAVMHGMFLFGVGYCGYGILTGTISYGTLTAVIQLVGQISTPFVSISGYLPKFYAMLASAERLMEIEQYPEEYAGQVLDVGEARRFYGERLSAFGLQDAGFSYYPTTGRLDALSKDASPVVLRDINLEVRKGDCIAFCGPSGCGKSTVLKLVMGIYRLDAGERYLRVDGGERVELTARWRRLFAYVPQGNQLMSGTIREVVTVADPRRRDDDGAIHSALETACADFVDALEDGLDTLLGERGTGLSEGQMQRLAVARAVFSQSPVLLLDEATSALDEATEGKLLENLKGLRDRTIIIVTHRPAALAICNRVVQFSDGGIVEAR